MVILEKGNTEADMNVEQVVLTEHGEEVIPGAKPCRQINDNCSSFWDRWNCGTDEKAVEDDHSVEELEPLAKEPEGRDELSRYEVEAVISLWDVLTVAPIAGVQIDSEDLPVRDSCVSNYGTDQRAVEDEGSVEELGPLAKEPKELDELTGSEAESIMALWTKLTAAPIRGGRVNEEDLPVHHSSGSSGLPSVPNEQVHDDSPRTASSSGRRRTKRSRSWRRNGGKPKPDPDFEEVRGEERPKDRQGYQGRSAHKTHIGQNGSDSAVHRAGEGGEAQLENTPEQARLRDVGECGQITRRVGNEKHERHSESVLGEPRLEDVHSSEQSTSDFSQHGTVEGYGTRSKNTSEEPQLEEVDAESGKNASHFAQNKAVTGSRTQLESMSEGSHLEDVQGSESAHLKTLSAQQNSEEESSYLNLKSRSLGRWADICEDVDRAIENHASGSKSQDVRLERSSYGEQDFRARSQQGREPLASREPSRRRGQQDSRARRGGGLMSNGKLTANEDTRKDEQRDFRSRTQQGVEPEATHKNWIARKGFQRVDSEGRAEPNKGRGRGRQGRESGPQNHNTKDFGKQKFESQNQTTRDFGKQKFESRNQTPKHFGGQRFESQNQTPKDFGRQKFESQNQTAKDFGKQKYETQSQATKDLARQKLDANRKIVQEELMQKSRQSLRSEFQKAGRVNQWSRGRDELEMKLENDLIIENGEVLYLNT